MLAGGGGRREREEVEMAQSLRSVGAVTLFVADPQRSKEFYAQVFEVGVAFEDADSVALRFDNLILNLLRRGAPTSELLGPLPEAAAGTGASFELTIWVDDADAVCDLIVGRGATIASGPVDRPWGLRTAAFCDPDGHVWEVAAAIPAP